jgi:hypothetical protein
VIDGEGGDLFHSEFLFVFSTEGLFRQKARFTHFLFAQKESAKEKALKGNQGKLLRKACFLTFFARAKKVTKKTRQGVMG